MSQIATVFINLTHSTNITLCKCNSNFQTKVSSKIVVWKTKALDKTNAVPKGKTTVDWHETKLISRESECWITNGPRRDNKCEDWKKI